MSKKVRLIDKNSGWGVLNLTLGSTMSEEECLEIVKKLDDISQNKFYTINVYDKHLGRYLGNFELLYKYGDYYNLKNIIYVGNHLISIAYLFHIDGKYERTIDLDIDILKTLSRLSAIEQHLDL